VSRLKKKADANFLLPRAESQQGEDKGKPAQENLLFLWD
jgi:hypothetical protein